MKKIGLFCLVIFLACMQTLFVSAEEQVIHNCDTSPGFNIHNIDASNYIEGEGCVSTLYFVNPKIILDCDVSCGTIEEGSAFLSLYFYVSTASNRITDQCYIQLEMGEGSYRWTNPKVSSGWNSISLALSDAEIIGEPVYGRISGFEINFLYDINKGGGTKLKVDDIRLTDIDTSVSAGEIQVVNREVQVGEKALSEADNYYYELNTKLVEETIVTGQKPMTGWIIGIVAAAVVVIAGAVVGIILKSKRKNS